MSLEERLEILKDMEYDDFPGEVTNHEPAPDRRRPAGWSRFMYVLLTVPFILLAYSSIDINGFRRVEIPEKHHYETVFKDREQTQKKKGLPNDLRMGYSPMDSKAGKKTIDDIVKTPSPPEKIEGKPMYGSEARGENAENSPTPLRTGMDVSEYSKTRATDENTAGPSGIAITHGFTPKSPNSDASDENSKVISVKGEDIQTIRYKNENDDRVGMDYDNGSKTRAAPKAKSASGIQKPDTKIHKPDTIKEPERPAFYYYSDYLEDLRQREKARESQFLGLVGDEERPLPEHLEKNYTNKTTSPGGGYDNHVFVNTDQGYENKATGLGDIIKETDGYPKALSTIPAEEPKKDEQPEKIYNTPPSYHGSKDRSGSMGTDTIEEVDIGDEKGYSPLYAPSQGGSSPLDTPSDGGSTPHYSPSKGGSLPLDTPSQSGHSLGDILNNKNSEQDKPTAEIIIPSNPIPNKGYFNSKHKNKPTTADDWNRHILPEGYNEQFNPDNWNRRFNEDYNRQMIQQQINQQNQNAAIYYNQVHRHH